MPEPPPAPAPVPPSPSPAPAPAVRAAIDELLLTLADDEFVIGFADSEWTGIAPLLEEDVAMSSIAQDELGHARAFYELLATLRDDGTDADGIAYGRAPEAYRHCRLVDHPRGDWAFTIARRLLYDLADEARLAAVGGGWPPLADLVGKIRREERYHVMHAMAWLDRLGRSEGPARTKLLAALDALSADAATVFAPLRGEAELLAAGVLATPLSAVERAWRSAVGAAFEPLGLPVPGPARAPERGRTERSPAFAALHETITSVRRLDPGAAW